MQSADLEEIKAAVFEQAYHPCTRVSWGMAQVMAVRRSKGQLLVQLRGRGRRIVVRDPLPRSVLFLSDEWAEPVQSGPSWPLLLALPKTWVENADLSLKQPRIFGRTLFLVH